MDKKKLKHEIQQLWGMTFWYVLWGFLVGWLHAKLFARDVSVRWDLSLRLSKQTFVGLATHHFVAAGYPVRMVKEVMAKEFPPESLNTDGITVYRGVK